MRKKQNRLSIFDHIWSVFASIRLSVLTLLLLAATSIIGTLIPQNQAPPFYTHIFGDTFFTFFSFLNLFDMYHSWWFLFLLLILAINIIVCSMDRFPAIWKIVRKKPRFSIDRFKKSKHHEHVLLLGDPHLFHDLYKDIFRKKFTAPQTITTTDGLRLFAEKGRWTRLGVYIVHLSVLVLLAGGFLGSIAGFEGTVKIKEGESTDIITLKHEAGKIKLPFQIRCDKFKLTHYDTGIPKEYRSDLTLLEKDKEILKKSVIVNKPLRHQGINIFQSFYGSIPDNTVVLEFTSKASGMVYEKTLSKGEEVKLPENAGSFKLHGFIPSYRFRGHNIGESFVGQMTPPEGTPREVILPLQFTSFDKMFKPAFSVAIKDFDKTFYTGLQVTKDPGVFLVYTGFILMLIGCCITFFMSHQSMCMDIEKEDDQKHIIHLYGTTNKNQIGMQTRLSIIAKALETAHASEANRLT